MSKLQQNDYSEQQQNEVESNQLQEQKDQKQVEKIYDPFEKKKEKKQHKKQNQHDYYADYLPTIQQVQQKPPNIIVVQGPPKVSLSHKCGKSTLIRSIVKHYTGYKVDQINGTATMRTSKTQRITLFQAPNNIHVLIDLSKIADLVLLMIDASIGFEMETFQFLSLLKSHSFPNIMGVLTHLDFFKDGKQLRKTRKMYKKRFEYQVGNNYKLFNLVGCKNNTYIKRDIINMARFFSIIKVEQSEWKSKHPFILIDRFQKNSEQTQQEIEVSFYGYIRGGSFRPNIKMHIVGLGNYQIKQMVEIDDPCPIFKKQKDLQYQDKGESIQQDKKVKEIPEQKSKKKKKRTLKKSEKILYSPGTNLGVLELQRTGGYITIPQDYVVFTKINNQQEQSLQQQQQQGVRMIRQLQMSRETINDQLKRQSTMLQNEVQIEESGEDQNIRNQQEVKMVKKKEKQKYRKIIEQFGTQQKITFDKNNLNYCNLEQLIYRQKSKHNFQDTTKYQPQFTRKRQQYISLLRHKFVTGYIQQQDIENQKEQKQQQKVFKLGITQKGNFRKRGQYVKLIMKGLKRKHVDNFSYNNPIILSKINVSQDNYGFLKTRIKKHRWYENLLKSYDPFIVSCGWRRYQTIPVFFTIDPNQRNRFLKYTSQHDFCYCVFYGNFMNQGTGFLITQTLSDQIKKFRIAASGQILQINKSFDVQKKLKLIGQPYKIFKNTAFIKNMFTSKTQVELFKGASIKTVSGIRGQIKKSINNSGSFRATFQDKILRSDIIFCRTWIKVNLQKYYNPIINYQKQRLMRTTWQLRKQKNLETPNKKDSEYRQIERLPRKFEPLIIPKKLEQSLPFKSKQKWKQRSTFQKIKEYQNDQIPKILGNDKDKQISALLQRLNTIKYQRVKNYNKQKKKKEKLQQKVKLSQARERPKMKYYEQQKKELKKKKYRQLSKKKKGSIRKENEELQ